MTNRRIGHYRILDKIGEGAMGEVFRARDESLHRDVAIKLIRPASNENPDHLRRFEQEAKAAASLSHPNILAIYEFGFDNNTPYIVSELLEGKDLRATLGKRPLASADALNYGLQIVSGMSAAHERHIVHRDLKPENIFLTHDGRIKILDFGVAKHQPPLQGDRPEELPTVTKQGTIVGTYAYMAPEQLRSQPVDGRSDIFSFGAIFYEMLTGTRAFSGETEVDTITAVLKEQPAGSNLDAAAVPGAYREVVRHCLEKDPANRFQTAKDLAFTLQAVSGGTIPVGPGDDAKSKRPRAVLPWIVAAMITAIALGVFLIPRPAPKPPQYQRLTFEAGTVYTARFASNGQAVVYSAAWDGGATRLFSTVAGSSFTQGLQFTDANLLAVSRNNDLALVVHGAHNSQLETANGTLARAPLAGGAPHEIEPDVRWADWDPEGNLTAIVHYAEGHSRLEYPIGTVLYQNSGWISNIRFSPQGDSIAFIDHPELWDHKGSVCIVDLSAHLRRLTPVWESVSGLAWRPDGKEVWFTASEKGINLSLKSVTLSGQLRSVLNVPGSITLQDIAPDGRVLISANSRRLALGYAALGSPVETDISWHDWNSARDISPDGKFVLFEDASEAAGPNYGVVVRSVDGSLPVQIGEGTAGSLSPDGKWAISLPTSHAPEVTLLPVGSGQPRKIVVPGLEHLQQGWSRFLPNGQQIALIGNLPGHGRQCFVIDIDGGKSRAVTPEGILCGPASPDSQFLVGSATGTPIAIYPINGGSPRPLPNIEKNFTAVQWSKDGSSLFGYHLGEFPSRIYKFNITTGTETTIRELKPIAPAGVVSISPVVVNREGTQFLYSYYNYLSVLYLISGLR